MDRAFLTLYANGPDSLEKIERRIRTTQNMLTGNRDDEVFFAENLTLVRNHFLENPLKSGSIAVFACWAINFFQAHPLKVEVPDLLWVGPSPYIRPLARLQDDFEDFAVVIADNTRARIHLVTSQTAGESETVAGNIKNHVRKGGWSQQRYERRRDKQLGAYAKEIVAALEELDKSHEFDRIVAVGSKETLREIENRMPKPLLEKLVATKNLDLGMSESDLEQEILDLFTAAERRAELKLWEHIKSEYMQQGRAAVGIIDVLHCVQQGRADQVAIAQDVQIDGYKCRNCGHVDIGLPKCCSSCGSPEIYGVDLVNVITESAMTTSAKIDFMKNVPGLIKVGSIAALLRY